MSPDEVDVPEEDNCIRLRTTLILNHKLTFCPKNVLRKFQSQVIQFPLGLQEEDFLSQLRSTYPQLDGDVPFELFSIDDSRKLIPLDVTRRTPEEIQRFIVFSGNRDTKLYIQPKTEVLMPAEEQPNEEAMLRKRYLPFRIRLLEDPNITSISEMRAHLVSNLKMIKCRADLDVLGFRTMLMTKFQKLRNKRFSFLVCTPQGDLVPLRVGEETSENMYEALQSGTLFIRFAVRVPPSFRKKKGRRSAAFIVRKLRWSMGKLKQQNCEMSMDDDEAWNEQMLWRNDHVTLPETDQSSDTGAQSLAGLSCKVCGVLHKKKSLLTKHAVSHIDDPRTMCGVCGRCFPSANKLGIHLLGHQTIHICDTCGKSFVTRSGLKKHRASHTEQRPHTCNICNKTFALESVMKTHLRFHDKDKPARCKFCHKAFTTESQLRSHSVVHSSERPYMCHLCGKALKSVKTLSVHIRNHTQEGMVDKTCQVCGRKFYSLTHLNTHMKTHKI